MSLKVRWNNLNRARVNDKIQGSLVLVTKKKYNKKCWHTGIFLAGT